MYFPDTVRKFYVSVGYFGVCMCGRCMWGGEGGWWFITYIKLSRALKPPEVKKEATNTEICQCSLIWDAAALSLPPFAFTTTWPLGSVCYSLHTHTHTHTHTHVKPVDYEMTLIFMCKFDIGLRVNSLNFCLDVQVGNYWIYCCFFAAACLTSDLPTVIPGQFTRGKKALAQRSYLCNYSLSWSIVDSKEDFLFLILFLLLFSPSFFQPERN